MEPEAPTWPAITETEARAVLAQFPVAGELTALNWHSPRPFSAAALVETGQGAFFLKRHHRLLRSAAALAQEHGFMAHLRSCGLSVPHVMNAADGASAIERGDWTYELHRQAPGADLYRDRPSWTPYLSLDHAFQAGVAMARLHLAASTYPAPARADYPLVASFTIMPSRDPLAALDAYCATRPALAKFMAGKPWRADLAGLFARLGAGLHERLAGQPTLWTHNDWHPSNLLWADDGTVSTIFDFGLATRTCALHDLATAIERTAFPWLQMETGQADLAAACAIVAGYRTILPLGQRDVDTIARLLPLVHVEYALSEVDYFAGIVGDQRQAQLAWDGYLIDHAEWFLQSQGQAFLKQFAGGALG